MSEQKTLEQLIMEAIDFCTHTRCKKCEYSGKDTADDYKGKCRGRMIADLLRKNGVGFVTDNNVGGKWISVTERLPELIPCNAGTAYSEAVIVWTDGRKAMIAVWDGIDFLCAADYWEAWGENITHWMPLPEPPKEGE